MAALTITPADVAPVLVIEQFTAPTAEAMDAGEYARLNTTTGKLEYGNASSAGEVGSFGGILLTSASPAGEAATILRRGIVDVGDALDALDFDDPVYLNDTDGSFGDAAGTVSTVIGRVVPGWANTTADKLLYVDF